MAGIFLVEIVLGSSEKTWKKFRWSFTKFWNNNIDNIIGNIDNN